DHRRGLRWVCEGRPDRIPADGFRRRDRAAHRRDSDPFGDPALGDEAARPLELVPAAMARLAAADPDRAQPGLEKSRGRTTAAPNPATSVEVVETLPAGWFPAARSASPLRWLDDSP